MLAKNKEEKVKRNFILTAAVVLIMTVGCFAGPFSDVPKGHYGYDVLKQAQDLGLITTDVSGTMTRYEMATAVAEILSKQDIILAQAKKRVVKKKKPIKPAVKPVLKPIEKVEPVSVEAEPAAKVKPVDPRKFVTKAELQEALADYATKDNAKKAADEATKDVAKKADLAGLATKADVDANKKSIDEFRAALGRLSKDLKEELSAIGVRLSDLEKGQAELKDKVSDLEKKIPDVGGELRFRGERDLQDKVGGATGQKDTTISQRTRVRLTKSAGENAFAVVQFRQAGAFTGTTEAEVEIATVNASTKVPVLGDVKFSAGRQYFSLGAYGLLVHDNDSSKGALIVEKSFGKLNLSGVYAQIVSGGGLRAGKLMAGRIELPVGSGKIGATLRLKGADAALDDIKQGMAVDIKTGPITAEYAMFKYNVANAENNKALVAGVELGKKITLNAAQIDKTYGLKQCVTSVTQEDLPLIVSSVSDKTDKTTVMGATLKLGALDVEVVKVNVNNTATIDGHSADSGLAARVTLTRDLATNVQLQLRATQIGKGDDMLLKGRGQLLIKF